MSKKKPAKTQRITFNVTKDLKTKLTKMAKSEGIPRGEKIIELIEIGIQHQKGVQAAQPTYTALEDLSSRVTQLEKELQKYTTWKNDFESNVDNLEKTVANILNMDLDELSTKQFEKKSSGKIPQPKKK